MRIFNEMDVTHNNIVDFDQALSVFFYIFSDELKAEQLLQK